MKGDYPAAREGGEKERRASEMVNKRMKVKEDEGADTLLAAKTQLQIFILHTHTQVISLAGVVELKNQ